MKYRILIFIMALLLNACKLDSEVGTATQRFSDETIWVWIQLNVPEEQDSIESYYYYARINKDLYTGITTNKIEEGFILLRDVRYWNTDDVIEIYDTDLEKGVVTFRVEHIVHMVEVKNPPEAGYTYDENDPLPELTDQLKSNSVE